MSDISSISSERILNIGKMVVKYYEQLTFKPSVNDFELWIESLKEPMKSNFREMGFEKCNGFLNFKRFVLELNDYGLDAFLKKNLAPEDFQWWEGNNI